MGDLVILEDGHDQQSAQLTEEAFEVGCSYLEVLFDPVTGGLDGGRDWLPTWSWQTAEQTEHAVYRQLANGSQSQYVAGRLMLVEVPTGTEDSILEEYTRRGGARMQVYRPLPAERSCVRGGAVWWWPCPVCAYPMRLTGELLRCDFLPHQRKARVLLRPGRRPGDPPEVVNGPPGLAACRGEGVLCLDWPVWRHLTVPGLTEVELMRWLERKGLEVERWGEMDSWDVGVTLPDGRCLVDVKDVANEQSIIDRPPRAKTIVVPSYRSEQVKPLRAALEPDGYAVHTVASFKRLISAQVQRGRHEQHGRQPECHGAAGGPGRRLVGGPAVSQSGPAGRVGVAAGDPSGRRSFPAVWASAVVGAVADAVRGRPAAGGPVAAQASRLAGAPQCLS
ncbi:hypothetical protein ACFQ0G_00085 [Streptomyces chiangmaiensis]